jgi:5-methylcytosine-specific restriction protein B
MRLADEILQHIVDQHLVPAWGAGEEKICLRAGAIHKELGLRQRIPAVCSVLGSNRFQKMTGVLLLERRGPQNGSSATFIYKLK